jgi:hypothetical protein
MDYEQSMQEHYESNPTIALEGNFKSLVKQDEEIARQFVWV